MKNFLVLSLLSIHLCLYSQETFSKLVNLNLALDNNLTDMEVSDSFIYVSASHLCTSDTNINILTSCTSLSKYDHWGNLTEKQLLDTFTPEGSNRLLLSNGQLYLSGHWHQDFSGRPTIVLKLNDSLKIITSYQFPSNFAEAPNNEGLIEYHNSLYLYGYKILYDEHKTYSNIIRINSETKVEEWDKIYSRAKKSNGCNDLQPTNDGNLIYIHNFYDKIGAGGEFGTQIVKMDTFGTVIDSFEFKDLSIDNPRLLASNEGNIYFTSQNHPYPHTIPSNGRINKLKSNFKELEWSLLLPSNGFIDAHKYRIYDYTQALNGDIVACGTVWEEGPDGPIGTPLNHTWNGFIARVTQSGKLRWLRIYRQPNNLINLPPDQFGDFRHSNLSKIHETSTGLFITGGTVYFTETQTASLSPDESLSDIWLMTVDQNGCLEGEECNETIIINGKNDMVSISNVAQDYPNIFPNPSNGVINFSPSETIKIFEVYNLEGKLLEKGVPENGTLHTSNRGFLILKLISESGSRTIKALIN
ncbi:MAG TPA: T9SS type A sorting domain-containing protein [Saprospiraceae bacterium]|nr:T9SS type A sorting domain-containing protein [Saprospiraceae bacterium]